MSKRILGENLSLSPYPTKSTTGILKVVKNIPYPHNHPAEPKAFRAFRSYDFFLDRYSITSHSVVLKTIVTDAIEEMFELDGRSGRL